MSGLVDMTGRPISTARMVPGPSRDAGSFRDPISGWHGPQIHSPQAAARERAVMQRRAGDLASNDWAAGSALDAISMNAVGTGLLPKAAIPADMLGIDAEEALQIGKSMEWAYSRWILEADVRGMCHFHDLQLLGIRSMLSQGELLHLTVMLEEKDRQSFGRLFSFALQAVRPQRLQTPVDLQVDPSVRDGVRVSSYGRPEGYYIANPAASVMDAFSNIEALTSADFSYKPARAAHRRLVFHLFRHETEEQTRGVSCFAKGISLFRNLSDALNYELFAQVIAASFPVFIATESGQVPLPQVGEDGEREESERYHELKPGSFLYGDANQKPYPLESKRPSANFSSFVEIILRAMAASQGIPYETLAKDYSKTNYSSMRAALNEAWKLYNYYRQWFARSYCQPIWEMVIEEAVLRGYVTLPSSAPDFYAARELWCNASWIGPARGFVDPVKEIQAVVMALNHNLMTYGEAWGERGGDWDEGSATILHEAPTLRRIVEAKPPVTPVTATGKNGVAPESAQADEEEKA
ncbi:phage portal protein [Desulfovibrio sp.]|uniref:phage portal protein n=1 Tax=Desulfovibrio sp. TaxID=885 RepID=UPI0025BC876C|nr:phage portal protein [Desulfovibrio sp.]